MYYLNYKTKFQSQELEILGQVACNPQTICCAGLIQTSRHNKYNHTDTLHGPRFITILSETSVMDIQ
jgi:hypothetical protein